MKKNPIKCESDSPTEGSVPISGLELIKVDKFKFMSLSVTLYGMNYTYKICNDRRVKFHNCRSTESREDL